MGDLAGRIDVAFREVGEHSAEECEVGGAATVEGGLQLLRKLLGVVILLVLLGSLLLGRGGRRKGLPLGIAERDDPVDLG